VRKCAGRKGGLAKDAPDLRVLGPVPMVLLLTEKKMLSLAKGSRNWAVRE
jgi:hypothetical protein